MDEVAEGVWPLAPGDTTSIIRSVSTMRGSSWSFCQKRNVGGKILMGKRPSLLPIMTTSSEDDTGARLLKGVATTR